MNSKQRRKLRRANGGFEVVDFRTLVPKPGPITEAHIPAMRAYFKRLYMHYGMTEAEAEATLDKALATAPA